jgi:hypothetical protein
MCRERSNMSSCWPKTAPSHPSCIWLDILQERRSCFVGSYLSRGHHVRNHFTCLPYPSESKSIQQTLPEDWLTARPAETLPALPYCILTNNIAIGFRTQSYLLILDIGATHYNADIYMCEKIHLTTLSTPPSNKSMVWQRTHTSPPQP